MATTISTDLAAPVIAGMRLRAGRTGSGKGAGRMVAQAITTARAAGVSGKCWCAATPPTAPARWWVPAAAPAPSSSLVLTKNSAVQAAIETIPDDAFTPVHYPG